VYATLQAWIKHTRTYRFESTCFPKSVFHFGGEQNTTPLDSKDQPSCQGSGLQIGSESRPGVPVPVRNQLCRRFVRIKLCTGAVWECKGEGQVLPKRDDCLPARSCDPCRRINLLTKYARKGVSVKSARYTHAHNKFWGRG